MLYFIVDQHGKTHTYEGGRYEILPSKDLIRVFKGTVLGEVVGEFYKPSSWWKSDPKELDEK